MKKLLFTPLVFALLVGSVFAQTTSPRDLRATIREERKDVRTENREDRKASISALREEIKARWQAIRDEKKLQILSRLEEKLAQINKRRAKHFLKVLERLSAILDKIQSRSDKAKAKGKDVSSVEAAIAAARSAITAAQTAVNAQALKIYEITINGETTARNDVGAAMKKLQQDLQATREFVNKARTAVFDALRALTRIVGSDGGTATPSATPT